MSLGRIFYLCQARYVAAVHSHAIQFAFLDVVRQHVNVIAVLPSLLHVDIAHWLNNHVLTVRFYRANGDLLNDQGELCVPPVRHLLVIQMHVQLLFEAFDGKLSQDTTIVLAAVPHRH